MIKGSILFRLCFAGVQKKKKSHDALFCAVD